MCWSSFRMNCGKMNAPSRNPVSDPRLWLRTPQRVSNPQGNTGDDPADRGRQDPTVLLTARKQGKPKHDAENDERRTEHHTATPLHSWLIIPQAMPKQYTEEGKHVGARRAVPLQFTAES